MQYFETLKKFRIHLKKRDDKNCQKMVEIGLLSFFSKTCYQRNVDWRYMHRKGFNDYDFCLACVSPNGSLSLKISCYLNIICINKGVGSTSKLAAINTIDFFAHKEATLALIYNCVFSEF